MIYIVDTSRSGGPLRFESEAEAAAFEAEHPHSERIPEKQVHPDWR